MAQPVKEVATKPKPELEPQNSHGKREMTLTIYTQYMTTAACVCSHKINKIKNNWRYY